MQQQTATARSIPIEIATFLRNRGDEGATLEDIAVGTNRSEEDVRKHLPEARQLVRSVAVKPGTRRIAA